MRWIVLSLVFAACNNNLGGGAVIDAHVDSYQIPEMVTIGGTATDRTTGPASPVSGATVTAYAMPDLTTPIGTATTTSAGAFSMMIATHGAAVALVLKASVASYVDTYDALYVVSSDPVISVDMLTSTEYAAIYTTAGVPQTAGDGMLEVQVSFGGAPEDQQLTGAGGLVVTMPRVGLNYVLNVTPGFIAVSSTSATIDLTAYAGALTMGSIALIGGD